MQLSISLCDSLWGNRKQRFFYLFCVMYIWIFFLIFVHYKLIYTSILTGKCSGLEKRHVVIFWTFLYSNILNLNSVVFFLLGSNYPYCFLWIENFNYDKIFVDLLSIGRTTFLWNELQYDVFVPTTRADGIVPNLCWRCSGYILGKFCSLYHINVFRSSN